MQLTAVRERCCPGCDAPVAQRSARWCGRCGEALRAAAVDDTPARPRSGRWRQVALAAGAAAVVVGLLVSAGPIVDRLPNADPLADDQVASPGADVLDRVGRRYQPPPPAVREPTCLAGPADGCFRWHVADRDALQGLVVVAGDVVVVASPAARHLRAIDLRDGTELWTAELDSTSLPVTTTDDLVLSVERDGLTARDARDGTVRWVLDGFGRDGWLQARQVGDQVVLVVDRGSGDVPAEGEDPPHHLAVLVVDADDGEVVWRTSASGTAGIASDGTAIVVEDGALIARSLDGQVRWTVTPEVTPGGGWVTGSIVHVWPADGEGAEQGDQLYRVVDGAPLELTGHALAWTERRVLLHRNGTDAGPDGSLTMVVDDDVAWEVPAPNDCFNGVRIEPALVQLLTCDGAEVTLDLADGRQLSATDVAGDDHPMAIVERLGPYSLMPEDTDDPRSAWVVTDVRSGSELVRLPPSAFPVGREVDGSWSIDLGGVAVVQHLGGLTAIDLPDETPRPAAMLRTFAR